MKSQMKIFNILLMSNVCASILLAMTTVAIFFLDGGSQTGILVRNLLVVITLLLLSVTFATLTYFRSHSIAIEKYAHTKDSFIANVSHEIKTPVNAIIGLVRLLQTSGLSNRQQEIVTKINTSSDLLLNIINDVLDFAKISSGKLTFYNAPVSLKEILSSIENTFQDWMSNKGLAFESEYDFEEHLCLNIDKMRLTQVLLNLISNAVKFTDTGFVKLSVTTLSETDSKVYLKFSVQDTGFGINPRDLGLLFQEFMQLENYLTKQHQGTGLGLTICKYIVEHMGGKIWVESVENEGSQFFFTISAEKCESSTSVSDGQNPVLVLNGQGSRILVVEDVEINYEVVESLLQEANIVCDYAPNGLEAISKCKGHLHDGYYKVILMDIHMPVMDGYRASEILKREMNLSTPILALTATSIEPSVIEVYGDILDGVILKPFKYTDLYNALMPYFPLREAAFDRRLGISNLGGSEALFDKHFNRFRENYHDSGRKLEMLLQNQQHEEAFRLAHSVKGLAGTLGLTALQRAAEAIELSIQNGTGDLSALLPTYQETLDQILEIQK